MTATTHDIVPYHGRHAIAGLVAILALVLSFVVCNNNHAGTAKAERITVTTTVPSPPYPPEFILPAELLQATPTRCT
jgi:hypothetical protein